MKNSWACSAIIASLGLGITQSASLNFALAPFRTETSRHDSLRDNLVNLHSLDPNTKLSQGDRLVLTVGANGGFDASIQKGFGFTSSGQPYSSSPVEQQGFLAGKPPLFHPSGLAPVAQSHPSSVSYLNPTETFHRISLNKGVDTKVGSVLQMGTITGNDGKAPSKAEADALTEAEKNLIKHIQDWVNENIKGDVTVKTSTHFEKDLNVDSLEKMDILLEVSKKEPSATISDEQIGNVHTVGDLLREIQQAQRS